MKIKSILSAIILTVCCGSDLLAFSVDGRPIRLNSLDKAKISHEICLGAGVERYSGWEFPAPNSYILLRVGCKEILANDGKWRRNIFDVKNNKGVWETSELIATEVRYELAPPVKFIYVSSNSLTEGESKELIELLVENFKNTHELAGGKLQCESI